MHLERPLVVASGLFILVNRNGVTLQGLTRCKVENNCCPPQKKAVTSISYLVRMICGSLFSSGEPLLPNWRFNDGKKAHSI